MTLFQSLFGSKDEKFFLSEVNFETESSNLFMRNYKKLKKDLLEKQMIQPYNVFNSTITDFKLLETGVEYLKTYLGTQKKSDEYLE